jgi:hypothetical protein
MIRGDGRSSTLEKNPSDWKELSMAGSADEVPSYAGFVEPSLLEAVASAGVEVPRGEPKRLAAEVAKALLARATGDELDEKLADAAEALWVGDVPARVAGEGSELPARENPAAHALAYYAALPILARDEALKTPLEQIEETLVELLDDERDEVAPVLGRAATAVIGIDVEESKDAGYRFVAVYPPEGSEGVDVVGRAAAWLTRRMTMEGEAPRLAMRRFLALLAEEIELDLPLSAALIDAELATPMPDDPRDDRYFVALARGLVEEAVAERGFPW